MFSTRDGPKRLELLHELVPTAALIAMLVNPTIRGTEAQIKDAAGGRARYRSADPCPECQHRTRRSTRHSRHWFRYAPARF